MIPYRVYFSGGGVCIVAHVGAVMELAKHVPLQLIKEWMGVSAGALMAMCMSIGFTLDELYQMATGFDFEEIKETDTLPGWILHFGVDTGERLQKLVDACLHVKGLSAETFTFRECLERYHVSLKVMVTDLHTASLRVYSPVDTPDEPIAYVVRASMSFPYYFQPVICPHTGHFLADGAVISNYPMFVLSREERARTLSILIRTTLAPLSSSSAPDEELELDMTEWLPRPLNLALVEKTKQEVEHYRDHVHSIELLLGPVNILDFGLNSATKQTMIQIGQDAVRTYYQTTHRAHITRRRSLSDLEDPRTQTM